MLAFSCSDKEEPKKEKNDSSKSNGDKEPKNTKGKTNTKKGNEKDKDEEKDHEDADDDSSGKRKAKVIAGEVIKNWQSVSRGNKGEIKETLIKRIVIVMDVRKIIQFTDPKFLLQYL